MTDYSRIVPAYYRFERSRIPMGNDIKKQFLDVYVVYG